MGGRRDRLRSKRFHSVFCTHTHKKKKKKKEKNNNLSAAKKRKTLAEKTPLRKRLLCRQGVGEGERKILAPLFACLKEFKICSACLCNKKKRKRKTKKTLSVQDKKGVSGQKPEKVGQLTVRRNGKLEMWGDPQLWTPQNSLLTPCL